LAAFLLADRKICFTLNENKFIFVYPVAAFCASLHRQARESKQENVYFA
jgi:hypothetical protein